MYAAVLALAMSPQQCPEYPGIHLDDARAFGVGRQECRMLWITASNHKGQVRLCIAGGWNNAPDVCEAWERECDWRARCWYLLDDAVYCDNLSPRHKMRSLSELRELLGDADYYGGKMPAPFPSYRPSR